MDKCAALATRHIFKHSDSAVENGQKQGGLYPTVDDYGLK